MGITGKILLGVLCLFLGVAVLRLFSTPLKLALKVLLNTLLGFAALFLLNLASPLSGFSLGFNLFNALTIGILGIPGLVLLILLRVVLL